LIVSVKINALIFCVKPIITLVRRAYIIKKPNTIKMKKFKLGVSLFSVAICLFLFSCVKDDVIEVSEEKLEEAPVIKFNQSTAIEGQYIIVYKQDVTPIQRRIITKDNYESFTNEVKTFTHKVLKRNQIGDKVIMHAYAKTIQGASLQLTDQEVSILRKDKNIAYIEQDQIVSVTMGGPPGGGGGGGGSAAQVTPYGITRIGGAIDGTSAGTAWIIDSGIDLDHEDLNVDVSRSLSFLGGGGGNLSPEDQNGHGTHVAGTVGAIDNEIGVVGAAAGATLVAIRVLDRRGSGSISGVIAGVDHVGANASSGDAANMSLGGGQSSALDAAVIAASSTCPFALAAGNESTHANSSSPGRANGDNLYTVSSMNSSDNWSSFSNYGNPPVDYCAPGSSVYSTYKGGGYATLSGTSMAAPHVCGILLIGGITSSGTVNNDPDGNADPIAHH